MSGATLAGASCSMASSVITCTLVNVAVGEERALDLRVTGNALGTYPVQALLSADNDFITANNTGQVQVGVQSGVDLGVTAATSTATAYVTDAVDYTVDVTSHGTLAAQGGSVSINIGGIPIETFNDGPNTCTIQSANWVLFCQLADIAAGATTRITLRGRPDQARPANGIVSLNVQNDSNPNNNSATMSVAVSAEREIRISASTEELRAVVGTTYDITYTLNALGRHPAENARFSLQHPSMGIIESVLITGFACVADAEFTHCDLGTLSPGSVRTVAVRVRMTGNATSSVTASTRWTHGSGYAFSSVYTRIYANLTVDVAATASNAFPVDEDAVGSAAFSIETKGVDPAQNVTATIELAAPARLESLVVSNGPAGWTCTLLTAQRGRCTGSFNGGPRYDDRRAVLQFTYVSVTAGDHLATAAVNAANDGDPSNNAAQLTLQVGRRGSGSAGSTAARLLRNGETTTIDATIITGKNPVPNARLNPRASDESLVVESVTIGGVDCPQSGSGSFCELGTLPANSAIAVRAVFRAMVGERSTYATLNVYPDSDANSNNNHLAVQLFTLNPSDLQLQVAQNSVTATNGTSLQFPRINVHTPATAAT